MCWRKELRLRHMFLRAASSSLILAWHTLGQGQRSHPCHPRKPQGCFHSSGIQRVTLLADANYVGHRAYENCKQLVKVDISLTTLKILNMHTFSHCVSLIDICLPPTLQEIQAETFKGCLALASIDLPNKLRYIAHKAFGDCGQLLRLRFRRDVRVTWRRPYAESNAFESCFRLDLPWWLNYLPPMGTTGQYRQAFKRDLRKTTQADLGRSPQSLSLEES